MTRDQTKNRVLISHIVEKHTTRNPYSDTGFDFDEVTAFNEYADIVRKETIESIEKLVNDAKADRCEAEPDYVDGYFDGVSSLRHEIEGMLKKFKEGN